MGVQGYLSLYTILLGWKVYDSIFIILVQTGLCFLAFGFIAVKSIIDPYLSMGARSTGKVASRRFILSIGSSVAVFFLAFVPMVHMKPHLLYYKPTCNTSGHVARPGETHTTYDGYFSIPKDIKVPIIWYLVLAISNGITDQAKEAIACQPVNLRELQMGMDLTTITDPKLKQEVLQFDAQCYRPAYDKYIYDTSRNDADTFSEVFKKWGKDDLAWLGSHAFQTVPGYYDAIYAKQPVEGFPFNSQNGHDQIAGQVSNPQWGVPTCKAWWQTPDIGLRFKLYNLFHTSLKSWLRRMAYNNEGGTMMEDEAIRAELVRNFGAGSYISKGYNSEETNRGGIDNLFGDVVSRFGVGLAGIFEYPAIDALINMLPVIQAVLLFATIFSIAIILPLSGYSLRYCAMAAIFIFSITFCSFIWHVVSWLDQFILSAFYGVGNHKDGHNIVKMIWHLAEPTGNPEKNLVDITMGLAYVMLPSLWIMFTGWLGYTKSAGLSFSPASKKASDIGSKGGKIAAGLAEAELV